MIPVRRGSQRLPKKNYLEIGKLTVLETALLKAQKSKVFDRIVINTDDPLLEELASRVGVDFYLRNDALASSSATSDQVVLDFFNNNCGDKVFWLNTVSPLQTIKDIQTFVDTSHAENWKSGVSVNSPQVHALFSNKPLNFEWETGFARTQDLKAVNLFNYAMMGWHRDMVEKLARGQLFDEETYLVESSKWSSFLLKDREDLNFIKTLLKAAPDQG
tara:strand:- start:94 stop:744 length:651 start_codon:yes stop_codon:yes gene_type:complete